MRFTRSQVLAFLLGLEDDPARQFAMRNGAALIQEAVTGGLIEPPDESALADELGRLIRAGLVCFGWTNGGHHSPPEGAPWSAADVQAHGDYELTAAGRQEARASIQTTASRGPGQDSMMWFHVHLWVRDSPQTRRGQGTNFFNLREEDLVGRIVGPWDRAEPIMWNGQQVPVSSLTDIVIRTTNERLPEDGGFPTE